MQYEIQIKGLAPGMLVHNGFAAIDKTSDLAVEFEAITKKKGNNRTATDDLRLREIECERGFYLDTDGYPTIPAEMLRAAIEGAARKTRQGAQVREGMLVLPNVQFDPGETLRGIQCSELAKRQDVQHIARVVIQRNATARCRPCFKEWAAVFRVEVYEDLVDIQMLHQWLHTAGRQIGIGDWRPGKSGGVYGRFEVVRIDPAEVGE